MSPNEAQLRAALRHGEGDAPDVAALMSHAMRARRDRQRRRTSILTGTAVVAVVAAGTGLLISLGNGSESAGGGGANAGAADAPNLDGRVTAPEAAASTAKSDAAGSSGGGAFGRANLAPARALRLACPLAPARYMLPGGGKIGQYGSDEKLFARRVVAMKVCAYPHAVAPHPASTVLSSTSAQQFATSLESAPDALTVPKAPCPSTTTVRSAQLVVLPVSGDARVLKPVVITVGPCATNKATNGTAVRYVARLPKPVAGLLDQSHAGRPKPTLPARASGTS